MRRHAVGLIVTLALGLLVVPLAVEAQPSATVPRIGLLSVFAPANQGPNRIDTFRQALQELGYREGENILIEYRWGEGNPERLSDLAADLVRLPVDVIVTGGMIGARAAQHATTTIPIVVGGASD